MVLEGLAGVRRAEGEFAVRMAAVSDADWLEQSNCEDWSVGDLVDHVVGGNVFTIEVLEGAGTEAAMAAAVGAAELAHGDRRGAYRDSARRLLAAFASADLEGSYPHVVGEVSGWAIASMRTSDLALHAWDLARSVGADDRLDPELVQLVWDSLSPQAAELAASGRFGSGSTGRLPADAPLQARLLDITGRNDGT